MLFRGTPKFRKSRFLWLSPGPPSAPELTFAHAAVKNFISNPPFLCGAALISDRPLLSRNHVLSDIGFLDRTLCRTQHKNPDTGAQLFVGCCILVLALIFCDVFDLVNRGETVSPASFLCPCQLLPGKNNG